MARTFLTLLTSIALLTPLACGNGGTSSSSNNGGGGGSGGNGAGGNVMDCSAINTNACFTNTDCTSSSDRCEVVGMMDDGTGDTVPVACCVKGARGTGMAGASCMKETECASGLCEEDMNSALVCSKACTSDSDCPADLPSCVDISDTGFKGSFCAPPA